MWYSTSLARGIDSLNRWIKELGDREAEQTYRLTSECEIINYEVPRDGMHYFVFYLSSGSSVVVDVDFDINRFLKFTMFSQTISFTSAPLLSMGAQAVSSPRE